MAQGELTRLINEWQAGKPGAEAALFDALYKALHDIAIRCLRTERPGGSLGATALVHEAYLRFRKSQRIEFVDRQHFLALAARVMRRILVDRARARTAAIRAGERVPEFFADLVVRDAQEAEQILAIDNALEQLSSISPRQGRLVELRYFAGYTMDEAAGILGVSPRTAKREWQIARTRLMGALDGTAE